MMQNDIRQTEHDVLTTLMGKELKITFKLNHTSYTSLLGGFGQMFEKITNANERLFQSNNLLYENIEFNYFEKRSKWISHDSTAKKIRKESDAFYNYIAEIKSKITQKQKLKDPELKRFSEMDKAETLDAIWFNEGSDKASEEFLSMVEEYQEHVIKVFGSQYPSSIDMVEARFFIGDMNRNVRNENNVDQPWLAANFKGFPLISSLAKLTMMQNDIRQTEHDVLTTLMGKELKMLPLPSIFKLTKDYFYRLEFKKEPDYGNYVDVSSSYFTDRILNSRKDEVFDYNHKRAGKLKEGMSYINKLIMLRPSLGYVFRDRAELKFYMGSYKGALEDINKAYEKMDSDWSINYAYSLRSKIKYAIGDYSGAIEDRNKYKEWSINEGYTCNIDDYFYLGIYHLSDNNFEEACTYFNKVLNFTPNRRWCDPTTYKNEVLPWVSKYCSNPN